jgi:hypothetical protein
MLRYCAAFWSQNSILCYNEKSFNKTLFRKEGNILCVHTLCSRAVDNTDDAHFRISRVQLKSPLF